MKLDKILANLKREHEQCLVQVNLLAAKKERIEKYLEEARVHAAQTEEAVLALEGKTTQIREALQQALAPKAGAIIPVDFEKGRPVFSTSQNENLPPAEPGFKWVKNEIGEDVLIPLNGQVLPAPRADANNFIMPVEEDNFPDPSEQIL